MCNISFFVFAKLSYLEVIHVVNSDAVFFFEKLIGWASLSGHPNEIATQISSFSPAPIRLKMYSLTNDVQVTGIALKKHE